jgi:hypothetical protein
LSSNNLPFPLEIQIISIALYIHSLNPLIMKKIIMSFLMAIVAITAFSQTQVRGQVRPNGTYVPPYVSTSTLNNPNNNPNTGTITGEKADPFLYNYSNMQPYNRPVYSYFNSSPRTPLSYTYATPADNDKIKDNKGKVKGRKKG